MCYNGGMFNDNSGIREEKNRLFKLGFILSAWDANRQTNKLQLRKKFLFSGIQTWWQRMMMSHICIYVAPHQYADNEPFVSAQPGVFQPSLSRISCSREHRRPSIIIASSHTAQHDCCALQMSFSIASLQTMFWSLLGFFVCGGLNLI